jgi:3'(2'), 5'-bisphosphate nucleotidase
MTINGAELAQHLLSVARAAGQAILALYGGDAGARLKADRTPVTNADLAADRVIAERLVKLFPGVPIVSEESIDDDASPPSGAANYFLVDPLDGTREFLERTGEFTVNIGLIERDRPIAGIVHAPVLAESYVAVDGAAWWHTSNGRQESIRARACPSGAPVILASRFHRDTATDAFIAERQGATVITAGSALKFGVLARGAADLYPRFGRTMEWDTAAGHAVLNAAGGSVCTLDGQELRYGKPGFANPAFIARGRA